VISVGNGRCEGRCKRLCLRIGVDLCNLRPLYADPGHQSLLVEDKGVNALLQCCRGNVLAKAFVQNDQAWPGTEFPTVGSAKISERRVIHKE